MATFLMFGDYSHESIKDISAKRTEKALELIEKNSGKLKDGYALLGEKDLVLIVEFPSVEQAMKTSVALAKMLGVGFTTMPAVSFEDFDRLVAD